MNRQLSVTSLEPHEQNILGLSNNFEDPPAVKLRVAVLITEIAGNSLYVALKARLVRIHVRLKIDLDAVNDVLRAVELGGILGEAVHGEGRKVTEVRVKVTKLAAIKGVVRLDLLPAVHARVDERDSALDAMCLAVDLGSCSVVRVVKDRNVALV